MLNHRIYPTRGEIMNDHSLISKSDIDHTDFKLYIHNKCTLIISYYDGHEHFEFVYENPDM